MFNLLIYFLVGGFITTVIIVLEESSLRLLSGFAALMPVFTLVAYFFIGRSVGGEALSQNAKLVLYGSLFAWVPYMLVIIWLAPRINVYKTIGVALLVFFVLAATFLGVAQHYGWFQ